jgi:hypothetical protein
MCKNIAATVIGDVTGTGTDLPDVPINGTSVSYQCGLAVTARHGDLEPP